LELGLQGFFFFGPGKAPLGFLPDTTDKHCRFPVRLIFSTPKNRTETD
jgi:hypothetical protein